MESCRIVQHLPRLLKGACLLDEVVPAVLGAVQDAGGLEGRPHVVAEALLLLLPGCKGSGP